MYIVDKIYTLGDTRYVFRISKIAIHHPAAIRIINNLKTNTPCEAFLHLLLIHTLMSEILVLIGCYDYRGRLTRCSPGHPSRSAIRSEL